MSDEPASSWLAVSRKVAALRRDYRRHGYPSKRAAHDAAAAELGMTYEGLRRRLVALEAHDELVRLGFPSDALEKVGPSKLAAVRRALVAGRPEPERIVELLLDDRVSLLKLRRQLRPTTRPPEEDYSQGLTERIAACFLSEPERFGYKSLSRHDPARGSQFMCDLLFQTEDGHAVAVEIKEWRKNPMSFIRTVIPQVMYLRLKFDDVWLVCNATPDAVGNLVHGFCAEHDLDPPKLATFVESDTEVSLTPRFP